MKFIAALLLAALPMFAHAAIFKCPQADGSLRISDEPCSTYTPPAGSAPRNSDSQAAPSMRPPPAASAGGCGKPISSVENSMLKPMTDEREIARFSLSPGQTHDVSYLASNPLTVMFRVAGNEAMHCKYPNSPVGMSTDGKIWMHSYYGGRPLDPVNGKIALMFKNTGDEAVSVLVVAVEK